MSDFLTSDSLPRVDKQDKANRRMTVDPSDLLDLDLDDDDEEEEEEETAMHTTRSEPGIMKKSKSATKKKRDRRRSTIDPDDITTLLNDSTTSSKMEALTTASPAASTRSSSFDSKGNISNVSDASGQGEESFGVSGELPIKLQTKNDRRATLDASLMDNLLDDDDEGDTADIAPKKAKATTGKTRRHSVANIAQEGATMEFRRGQGMRDDFRDDGNTAMTAFSNASIQSMAPSVTQATFPEGDTEESLPLPVPSVMNTRRMTADAADIVSLQREMTLNDSENRTAPVQLVTRRRQTMMTGRDLQLPSPSPAKPRTVNVSQANKAIDNDNEDFTENITGNSAAAGRAYRPKSALKGGRRSSVGGDMNHTGELSVGIVEPGVRTSLGGNTSRYVMFGSPKAAEFDKEAPTNAITPLDRKEAKAMFSMEGSRVPTPVDDEDNDSATNENSEILEQWDRLTNDGSGSDSDEDVSMPTPSSRSNRRRSSMGFKRSTETGESDERESPSADLLHFGVGNDHTEEFTAHSVARRFSLDPGSLNDRTQQLEPDLMSMLENYDYRAEQQRKKEEEELPVLPQESTAMDVSLREEEKEGIEEEEEDGDDDDEASTEDEAEARGNLADDNPMDMSLNTSLNMSLSESVISTRGAGDRASILQRLKTLNSSSRRNTLSHAGTTPLGSKLSIHKQRRQTLATRDNMHNTSRALEMGEEDGKETAVSVHPHDSNDPTANLTVHEHAIERHVQVTSEESDHSFVVDTKNLSLAVESPSKGAEVNTATMTVPPSPFSPVSSSKKLKKRSSRSAPSSPGTPLTSESKRSRRKSPAKPSSRISLCDLLAHAGLEQSVLPSSSSTENSLARALREAIDRCSQRPALTKVVEAMLKHTTEATAAAKVEMDDFGGLPELERIYTATEVDEADLAGLGEACAQHAIAMIAEEEDVKMDAIAKQLEKQAKKIRHKAKAARRASTKLLKKVSGVQKRQSEDEKMKNAALVEVHAAIRRARKQIEEASGEIEALSDETSAELEKQKEQLMSFTHEYSHKSNSEQVIVDRLALMDEKLGLLESEVCDTRTKIGIIQSITHHRLSSFKATSVAFECCLSSKFKAVVDFKVSNEGGGAGFCIAEMNASIDRSSTHAHSNDAPSEGMAATSFHSTVMTVKDGPLSEASVNCCMGKPFRSVHNIVNVFAGYTSAFRLFIARLRAFTADGWNWALQGRDVVLFSPDDRFKLTLGFDSLLSGNIAGLPSTCLRNRDDRPVAELPIKAVLASLRSKFGLPLGKFPVQALKRELDSILKHL